MKYSLFLDDVRFPVEVHNIPKDVNWVIARSYSQFVANIIRLGIPENVSLDYDLNDYYENESEVDIIDQGKTGEDCLKLLLTAIGSLGSEIKPKIFVHSTNPKGIAILNKIIQSEYTL